MSIVITILGHPGLRARTHTCVYVNLIWKGPFEMELAPDSMIKDYYYLKRYRTFKINQKYKFEKLFTEII